MKRMCLTALAVAFVSFQFAGEPSNKQKWVTYSLPLGEKLSIRYGYCGHSQDQDITLFSHGIGGTADQAIHYINNGVFCTNAVATFDYLDAPAVVGKRNSHTGFAQQDEINCCKAAIKATIELNPRGIHLYGVSNGASTMINALNQLIAEKVDLSLIRTVVLESPFAQSRDCIEAIAKSSLFPSFFIRFLAKRWYKQIDFEKNKSIDAVKALGLLNIPVLFVALKSDTLVPYESTQKLFACLKNAGCSLAELLTIEDASCKHANIMTKETVDAVQAFYTKAQA